MPLFSVIMPVFNRAALVGQAIDSILAQTFEDYEAIVVDDGSTDDTPSVLARYGDKLRVYRQDNHGPGAARNLGIDKARGGYITFLDSDDLFFPWALATFRRAIEACNSPSFVAGVPIRFRHRSEFDAVTQQAYSATRYHDFYSTAGLPMWVDVPGAAIRADVLRQVGGFPSAHINAEDADLWMRLGTAPNFVRIDAPLIFGYRQLPDSAVADQARTFAGVRYMVERELTDKYPGGPGRRLERRKMVTKMTRPACLAALRDGRIEHAAWLFSRTWAWDLRQGRFRYVAGVAAMLLRAKFAGAKTR